MESGKHLKSGDVVLFTKYTFTFSFHARMQHGGGCCLSQRRIGIFSVVEPSPSAGGKFPARQVALYIEMTIYIYISNQNLQTFQPTIAITVIFQ